MDQFNVVFDWQGVGTANLDRVICKALIDITGKLLTGRIYRFYMVNMHWSATFIYNIIKPFIPQRGREKMQMPGNAGQAQLLLDNIDSEKLPIEYGGTGLSVEQMW